MELGANSYHTEPYDYHANDDENVVETERYSGNVLSFDERDAHLFPGVVEGWTGRTIFANVALDHQRAFSSQTARTNCSFHFFYPLAHQYIIPDSEVWHWPENNQPLASPSLTATNHIAPVQLGPNFSAPINSGSFDRSMTSVAAHPGMTPIFLRESQIFDEPTSSAYKQFDNPPPHRTTPASTVGPSVPSFGLVPAVPAPNEAEKDLADVSLPMIKLGSGAWKCLICSAKLRRKQVAIVHYWNKHGGIRLDCQGQCGTIDWLVLPQLLEIVAGRGPLSVFSEII